MNNGNSLEIKIIEINEDQEPPTIDSNEVVVIISSEEKYLIEVCSEHTYVENMSGTGYDGPNRLIEWFEMLDNDCSNIPYDVITAVKIMLLKLQ